MSAPEASPGSTVAPEGPVHSAVVSAGQLMVGGVVSLTVTSVEQVAIKPAPSVAAYVTVLVPSGYAPAPGSVTVAAEQTSVAVASPGSTVALELPVHSAVEAAGQLMDGAVVSTTVTCFE